MIPLYTPLFFGWTISLSSNILSSKVDGDKYVSKEICFYTYHCTQNVKIEGKVIEKENYRRRNLALPPPPVPISYTAIMAASFPLSPSSCSLLDRDIANFG